MMFVESKFQLGDRVYLITDAEQAERMITRIMIAPTGVTYCLNYGAVETWHYAIEISEEKALVT